MKAHDVERLLAARAAQSASRREFLMRSGVGLGAVALAALEGHALAAAPMHRPRARSVVYLHMSGGPPQQDLFDEKPELVRLDRQPCPLELIEGKRLAFVRGRPNVLAPPHPFVRAGRSGRPLSSLLPHLAGVVDHLCFVHSMTTTEINHAPAELLLFTGTPIFGGASLGAWINYGLGSQNADLPGYVVMTSGESDPTGGKSLWGSGYLPSELQGVRLRSSGDPVLFLGNPPGLSDELRRASLDAIATLGRADATQTLDRETSARVEQYELSFRMQRSVPEATDISSESKETIALYGAQPGRTSFANHCLMARRLVERGVRFIHLFDWGWDVHGTGSGDDLMTALPAKCLDVDRPIAALILDLQRRGLLEETLVVFGGEFGRTAVMEARDGSTYLGRDHHPDCFSMWLAGAGVRAGHTHGRTDALGARVVEDPVTVRDLQATILHLVGLDPHALSYTYQGLGQRLIGPDDAPRIVRGILA